MKYFQVVELNFVKYFQNSHEILNKINKKTHICYLRILNQKKGGHVTGSPKVWNFLKYVGSFKVKFIYNFKYYKTGLE